MVAQGGFTKAVKGREAKGKGEKERYTHLNAEFQEQEGEKRKLSSVINAKKKRKLQNGKDLIQAEEIEK